MEIRSPYAELEARSPGVELAVELLGARTNVWVYGDATAATTVLMVHGFRGDHHGLEALAVHLPDLRVIVPDLPGFGSSEPLPGVEHDIVTYATWLRTLVTTLGIQGRFVLLGHSFGSIVVAATLAGVGERTVEDAGSRRPDDVVLVNPIGAPALSGPRGALTRLAVFYYWLSAVLPERLGFAFLRNGAVVRGISATMTKSRDRGMRAWIHAQHAKYFSAFADRDVVLDAFRASVSHDVSEYAASVPEPTLLIAAEQDDITPVSAQRRLAGLFPHAELQVIPEVGHLVHYETPAEAVALMRAFLDRASNEPPAPTEAPAPTAADAADLVAPAEPPAPASTPTEPDE